MNNNPRIVNVVVAVGALLAIFLAVISIKEIKSIGYVGKSEQILNTISVNGKGEEVIIPDIATFSFTVTENGKTVADAQEKATTKTNNILKSVRSQGIEDKDIKTTSYNINPHYEYQTGSCGTYNCPGKNTLTGYDVSQNIEVKIRDLSKAGDLFTSIGAAGAQNLQGLTFTIDDIENVRAAARAKAIADAKAKADTIAKQLGVRLVRVTGYYENMDYPVPMYGRGGAMDAVAQSVKTVPPEVPTGTQEITSNISVTYEIR
jgi:uncharacterized protein